MRSVQTVEQRQHVCCRQRLPGADQQRPGNRQGVRRVGGFIRPGGTYNLYAQVADTGSPASGGSTVTANLSSIASGQTAASLSSEPAQVPADRARSRRLVPRPGRSACRACAR